MRQADTIGMHDVHTHAVRQVCAPMLEATVVEAWLHGRTPEGYQRAAIEDGERFWIAIDDASGVVGFASWREDELIALFVLPEFQGCGIGRKLFVACEEDARDCGSRIVRLNSTLNAETYYEMLGFRRVRDGYQQKQNQCIPHIEMERTTALS